MEKKKFKIGIVGAGIQGVCNALFLQKKGHEVTIFDKDDPATVSASYGFKQLTGTTPGEYAMSFAKSYSDEPLLMTEKERECQTFHSSSLSEIFFDTLDGIDCLRDPFSILK